MTSLYDFNTVADANQFNPPDGFPENVMEFEDFPRTMREYMAKKKKLYLDTRDLTATLATSGDGAFMDLDIASTNIPYTGYFPGLIVAFRTGAATQSGPARLQINSLGYAPIVHPSGSELAFGTIRANARYLVVYRSDNRWQLIGCAQGISTTPLYTLASVTPFALDIFDLNRTIEFDTVFIPQTFTLDSINHARWPLGARVDFIKRGGAFETTLEVPSGVSVQGVENLGGILTLPFGADRALLGALVKSAADTYTFFPARTS